MAEKPYESGIPKTNDVLDKTKNIVSIIMAPAMLSTIYLPEIELCKAIIDNTFGEMTYSGSRRADIDNSARRAANGWWRTTYSGR